MKIYDDRTTTWLFVALLVVAAILLTNSVNELARTGGFAK
jgi:hypothetical protein